jgi:hypothetical protein
MKPIQKDLRGITYILVDQSEVLKECESCAFAKRGDECNTPETMKMVWEVKKDRI